MSITVANYSDSVAPPDLLTHALDAGARGVWEYDIVTRKLSFDHRTAEILDDVLDGELDYEHFLEEVVHPEDREKIRNIARTIKVPSSDARFDLQLRLLTGNNTTRWLSLQGKILFHNENTSCIPVRVVGTARDVTANKYAEEALRESEARFRASFNCAAVGLGHVDCDGEWLHVNERLCQILGYTADELVEKTFQDLTHPEDLTADLAQVRRLLANEIDSYSLEKRYLHKNGSVVWANLTVGCVRKFDGSVRYFISVIEDIGERKRHESQVQILLHELTHRSKNILALVQGIARHTAATGPEFMPRFQDRLQGLAAAQDLVSAAASKGVELRTLVQSQLGFLNEIGEDRITLDGPDIGIDALAMRSVGMALHELATNAVKYGALAEPTGRVHITWGIQDEAQFVMCWVERGGPPVSPPDREGFGSKVMTDLIEQELGSHATLSFPVTGVVWELRCPVDRIMQDD